MFGSPWRTNYRGMTFTVVKYRFVISVTCLARSSSRVLRSLSCPASIIGQPCSMRIRYRGSPSKSLFCEVLRSFSYSEGTTIYFPIPRRKTVPWSLKHGGLFFARCCDHFRIPKALQFISQYLEGKLYRGR